MTAPRREPGNIGYGRLQIKAIGREKQIGQAECPSAHHAVRLRFRAIVKKFPLCWGADGSNVPDRQN